MHYDTTPNSAFPDALEAFQRLYMPSRNYAPKTRRSYGDDLRGLLSFLREQGCETPADVSPQDLEAYQAHLDARGLAGSSRRPILRPGSADTRHLPGIA